MEPAASTSDAAKKEDVPAKSEEVKPAASASTETKQPAAVEEEFPDPDEDDLDDLDDMLNDFSSVKVGDGAKAAPTASAAPAPASAPPPSAPLPASADIDGEDIQKQMQAGIEGLMGELGKSPEMQAGFEDLLNGMAEEMGKTGGLENFLERMTAAGAGPSAAEPPTTTAKGPSGAAPPPPSAEPADPAMDASFQETIRRTMERMQTSGEQATAAASTSGGDDFMSEMLKQLSSGDFNAEGSEEEFSKMLMGMMEQLTNKEILYEPMKELNDKFPAWLEKNKDSTPAEDLKRYEEQKAVVAEIVAKFEESTYADSNTADREYIVDRMQKMQAAGSPPSDLVGDMDSAHEAFNAPDEQCNPQ